MRWWALWLCYLDIMPHLYQWLLGGDTHIGPGEICAQRLGIAPRYYVVRWRQYLQRRDNYGDTARERTHHPWLQADVDGSVVNINIQHI